MRVYVYVHGNARPVAGYVKTLVEVIRLNESLRVQLSSGSVHRVVSEWPFAERRYKVAYNRCKSNSAIYLDLPYSRYSLVA